MTCAFNPTLIGYFPARPFAAANLFTKEQRRFAVAAAWVLTAGAIAQTMYSVLRWITAGRPPFSNRFESLVLFVWSPVVIYLALQMSHKIPVLGMNCLLSGLHSHAKAFARFDKRIDFVRKQVSTSKMGNRFWSNQKNLAALTTSMLTNKPLSDFLNIFRQKMGGF